MSDAPVGDPPITPVGDPPFEDEPTEDPYDDPRLND